MLVSLSWLKKYVRLPENTAQLAEDLTMAGLNVEGRETKGFDDPNVVVGKVLEVAPHPNADKLRLCRVDVGKGGARDIVCGAPNVAAGQCVLVALPGAKLPGGLKIRSSKIRGEKSDGMICSEIELGIGSDAAGIMVLPDEPAPGTPMRDTLGEPEEVFEIEVTPNRPDQLSHVGIAREVAAIYGTPLELPFSTEAVGRPSSESDFKVEIEDPADCPRYVGKRVTGLKVGSSPAWLKHAIESVGLHSVNNVVDITNYILLELGQPIHAFDFRTLKGSKILVRRSAAGETLLALDGNTHELTPDMLVIADDRRAVALAGVIGGEETAVHDDTTDLLIESANFNPQVVRRTRKALGINTDASYRFERGVDREMPRMAAERAAKLICEVAGGRAGDAIDNYPAPLERGPVSIRKASASRILGVGLDTREIEDYLGRLGFESQERSDDVVVVRAPSWRLDIQEEADLIEEVARLHGYNRIGAGWAYRCTTVASRDAWDGFLEDVASYVTSRGFSEVTASSFTDGQEIETFGWAPNDPRSHPIPLRNPLNSNHRYMRTSLLPGMLQIVQHNLNHGVRRLDIYQIGRVFRSTEEHDQLPAENVMLTMIRSRPEGKDFWNEMRQSSEVFEIKSEIERLLGSFQIDLGSGVYYDFDSETGAFRYATQSQELIAGGIVSDALAERYGFEQPVWHVTIDVNAIYDRVQKRRAFRPLPEYPASRRDLSLVAAQGTRCDDIEKWLVKSAGRLLESMQVFDVYHGDQLPEGRTAYGLRLNFRSPDRTLTDDEVDSIIEKILTNLKKQLGVELRS